MQGRHTAESIMAEYESEDWEDWGLVTLNILFNKTHSLDSYTRFSSFLLIGYTSINQSRFEHEESFFFRVVCLGN